MDDASPPKWHLAHTTWFFETFVLKPFFPGYTAYHPQFEYLFNSYYNGVGTPFPRPSRGFLSRPTVAQVMAYRQSVDVALTQLLHDNPPAEVCQRVILGCHHEQQHQELLLTDLKYNFGHNPLYPAYVEGPLAELAVPDQSHTPETLEFLSFDGGIHNIGTNVQPPTLTDFAFDNESPQHKVLMSDFALANRLVTNGEFLEFIEDGGYTRPDLWLAEGWTQLQQAAWCAPLYWRCLDGQWHEYRLDGLHSLVPDLPVVHVSAHEAIAYANWCGARLPTEFEFEVAAQLPDGQADTNQTSFLESQRFHPAAATAQGDALQQTYGNVWQWTASAYAPYPGFAPLPGTLGEYNGKFMSSQLVLRGASCVTARSHARRTYRNFFYPPDRWQFSGIRLAANV